MSTFLPVARCDHCARQFNARGHGPGRRFRCHCGEAITVKAALEHHASVIRCSACGGSRASTEMACRFCQSTFTRQDQDLNTMCPGCLTRMSDKAAHCHHCGLAKGARSEIGQLAKQYCPVCEGETKLHHRNFSEDVNVLECHGCAGLWLHHTFFENLAHTAELRPKAQRDVAKGIRQSSVVQEGPMYRKCPDCRAVMNRRNYHHSGVILDVCREHGIWFDAQELEDVLRHLSTQSMRKLSLANPLSPKEQQTTPLDPSLFMKSSKLDADSVVNEFAALGFVGEVFFWVVEIILS